VDVIAAACRERGASMIAARQDVAAEVAREGDRLVLRLRTPKRQYPPMAMALRGRHQVDNAIVAIRLLEELEAVGYAVPPEAIAAGVTTAHWPGRLDLRVGARGKAVLFDAAHNPAGARVLAAYLGEFHPAGLPIVFGVMKDKDVAGTLAPLLPFAAPLILTRPQTERALAISSLEETARHLGVASVLVEARPHEALPHAWSLAPLVCVAGSIFLVGEILADFDRWSPPPATLC
jgi:dihydrofolate synthase/folylpolyglutamate synthase